MLLHNKLQKDYTLNQSGYQLKLPLELETIIPKNDSVRLLSQFVGEHPKVCVNLQTDVR